MRSPVRWAGVVSALVGFSGTLASAPAHAQEADEFASFPSEDLTRLSYYPHPGRLYLLADTQYVPTDLSTPQNGMAALNTSTSRSWQSDLNVIYGLPWDGVRFGVADTWQIHHWTDTTSGKTGFVTQTDSAGFSDPTFQAQLRFINDEPTGLAADVALSTSPSWITHTVAASPAEGNDGKGYGTLGVGSTLYWTSPVNDVGIAGTLTRDFSGNAVNPEKATSSYDRSATWDWVMTATDRFHVTRDIYAQAAASFTFPYSYSQTNSASSAVSTDYQVPFHVNPSFLLGYRILSRFVVDAMYSYQNYGTTSSVAAPPSTLTNVIENTIELRARFEI